MADDQRTRLDRVLGTHAKRIVAIASPWTVILVITGCFHLYRDAIADAVIYFLVAAALALDAAGVLRFGHRSAVVQRLPRSLLAIGSAVLALPLVLAPLYGVVDTLVVVVVGVVVLALAWPESPRASRPPVQRAGDATRARRRSAILWSCVGLFFCGWELGAYLLGRPSAAAEQMFPPLSDLIDPVVEQVLGRTLLVVGWFAAGIALVRRGRHP
jgi:hypothetical protein